MQGTYVQRSDDFERAQLTEMNIFSHHLNKPVFKNFGQIVFLNYSFNH